MSTNPQVSDLLLDWEERHEQGSPISAEELCRDCPHLLDELRRKIAALQAMNPLMESDKQVLHEGQTMEFAPPDNGVSPPRSSHTLATQEKPKVPGTTRSIGPLLGVPGYEIVRELGRGGMGVVYLARQKSLGRLVALKMIIADPWTTDQHRQRFRAETETIARLQHPNIVQIYEVGETADRSFCALEYVDGGNLAEALDGKPCAPRHAAELLATIADAVQAAHSRGILHRDLKPANVLLSAACGFAGNDAELPAKPQAAREALDGAIPKLTDFGLAKQLEETSGLTETGMVMGTPSYMSPEQAAGLNRELGPTADVYALGAILYEMLTGRPPLVGPTPLETLAQVLERDPVPPRRLQPRLPRDLETICLKCLQKTPARRYGTARALADDLRRFLAGETILARPVGAVERLVRWCKRRPAVAALAAAVLGLLAVVVIVSVSAYVEKSRALISETNLREEAEKRKEEAEEQRGVAETLRGEAEKQSTVAREAAKQAQQERASAVAAKEKVREAAIRNRRLLYPYDMLITQQTWENDRGRARSVAESLAAWKPRNDEEDLRDFAWRYLWGQMYDNAGILPGHGRAGDPENIRGALHGAWLANGTLVTIDGEYVLRRWEPSTGKLLAETPLRRPGEGKARLRIDVAANGSLVAVLNPRAGVIRLVDPATGKMRRRLVVRDKRPGFVHLSPDGKLVVAYLANEGLAWQWETATGKRRPLPEPPKLPEKPYPRSSALAPDGTTLALRAGTMESQVALLNLGTMIPKKNLPARTTVAGLVFSPDGKVLAGGNQGGKVFLWDVEANKKKEEFALHVDSITSVAFSRDGSRLASGSRGGSIAFLNIVDGNFEKLAVGKLPLRLPGHTGAVHFVCFSADGRKLLSGSSDGTARVWDLSRTLGPPRLHDGSSPVTDLAFSADGSRFAAAQGPWIRLGDARRGQLFKPLRTPQERGDKQPTVNRIAFAPDGKQLAAGDDNGIIHLWDVPSRKHVATLAEVAALRAPADKRRVTALTFSPDGKYLVCGYGALRVSVGDYEQDVRVWDVAAKKVLHTLPHRNTVVAACFSRDGRLLATGCADGMIRTWDTRTWSPGQTFRTLPDDEKVKSQRIRSMALSPDGSLVAAGLIDGPVLVWEVVSGKRLFELNEHPREVNAVAFTPDGKTLVSGGHEHSVRLWNIASGRPELILRGLDNVLALAVSPDGNTILSSDSAGNILLWQAPGFDRIEASEK
jgi:WD40 repeat protein